MTGRGLILLSFAAIMGLVLSARHLVLELGATTSMSRFKYVLLDLPLNTVALCLFALVALTALFVNKKWAQRWAAVPYTGIRVSYIALIALGISVLGVHVVYHGHALSMDEWMTRLQGTLFVNGQISGEIPLALWPYGRAMLHSFVAINDATGTFASDYRPGMAGLYALFQLGGLGLYASSFMFACSVLMTALVARRIWPGNKEAPVIAAILVATSQQALAASMTTYAMSAHLFFNMAWLWLFLGNTTRHHMFAALVGVLTASLHQIHVHAFFAAPFFLLLLRPFRPRLIIMYAVIYLIGHFAIYSWDQVSLGSVTKTVEGAERTLLARLERLFQIPDFDGLVTAAANLARFLTWQNLAIVPLLLVLLLRNAWSPVLLAIAASILFSFLPYPFLMPDQGHGWGYRYLHGLIGPLAILGAAGWAALRTAPWPEKIKLHTLLLFCFIVSTVVMIPLRGWHMEKIVRPFAEGTRYVQGLSAEVVIVDSHTIFYGWDIVQGDPMFRTGPILMNFDDLTVAQIRQLCANYRTQLVGEEEVAPLGMATIPLGMMALPDDYAAKRTALASPRCANPAQLTPQGSE